MYSFKLNEDTEYSYEVEDFLLRVIFQNLYNYGSMTSYCDADADCDECMKCPTNGYAGFARSVRATCEELFDNCIWNDEPFDCCKYFQPLNTSYGNCYLLNSIQVEKYQQHWLNLELGVETGRGILQIDTSHPTSVRIHI